MVGGEKLGKDWHPRFLFIDLSAYDSVRTIEWMDRLTILSLPFLDIRNDIYLSIYLDRWCLKGPFSTEAPKNRYALRYDAIWI